MKKIVWVNNPENLTVLVNKNYRLSDEYEPDDLVLLEVPLYNRDSTNESNYLRKSAADALKQMFIVAKSYGYNLTARSGYRSYVTQVALYDRYVLQMVEKQLIPIVQEPVIVNIKRDSQLILHRILLMKS